MKAKIYGILLFFFTQVCLAQVNNGVILPSPSARQFTKFINYDTDLSNGLTKIQIPLFTYKIGNKTIPVTLRYHSSGIKVNQPAGEVGYGWDLDINYKIARTVLGRADDFTEMPVEVKAGISGLPRFSTSFELDEYLSAFVAGVGRKFSNFSKHDGEYDLFTFRTPDDQGTFIIDDRTNNIIKSLSSTTSKFSLGRDTKKAFNVFTITSGDGFNYIMGGADSYLEAGKATEGEEKTWVGWVVNTIADPFGNKASFKYDEMQEIISTERNVTLRSGASESMNSFGINSFIYPEESHPEPYWVQRLSQITTDECVIKIERKSNSSCIETIKVLNAKTNETQLKVVFSYHTYHAGLLSKVSVFRGGSTLAEEYDFDYYGQERLTLLKNYTPDYWGFPKFEHSTQPHSYPFFGPISLCFSNFNPFYMYSKDLKAMLNESNRESTDVPDYPLFLLKKINFPTGGNVLYEYELNRYESQSKIKSAGFRIHRISFEDSNKLVSEKEYKYGQNGLGEVVFDLADNVNFIDEYLVPLQGIPSKSGNIYGRCVTYHSSPVNVLVEELSAPVHYRKVIEYTTIFDGASRSPSNRYHKEYVFESSSEVGYAPLGWDNEVADVVDNILVGRGSDECRVVELGSFSPTFRPHNFWKYEPWNKPQLLSCKEYSASNELVKEESYKYTKSSELLKALKVLVYIKTDYDTRYYERDYTKPGHILNYADYSISTGGKHLIEKITTTYNNGKPVLLKEKYSYNNLGQRTFYSYTNAKGQEVAQRDSYAADFEYSDSDCELAQSINNLKRLNIVNPVLETSTSIKKDDVWKTISATLNIFHKSVPALSKILVLNNSSTISNFNPLSNGLLSCQPDTRYIETFSFPIYDNKGNLLNEIEKGGLSTVYLWGYNGLYPVARIKGVSFDSVKEKLGVDNFNAFDDENSLKSELAALRKHFPQAQITTYTYKPLVGIKSEVDLSGKEKVYVYNTEHLLSHIKNDRGEITTAFEYNLSKSPSGSTPGVSYQNVALSRSFTRDNCINGSGSDVVYSVASGKYTSLVSQEDADRQALDDLEHNGQRYANEQGSCLVSYVVFNRGMFWGNEVRSICFEGEGNRFYFFPEDNGSFAEMHIPGGNYQVMLDTQGQGRYFLNFHDSRGAYECKEFDASDGGVVLRIRILPGENRLSIGDYCGY